MWPATWKRTTRPPSRPSFRSSTERTAPSMPCSTNCVPSSSVPWAGRHGSLGKSASRWVGCGGLGEGEGQRGGGDHGGLGLGLGARRERTGGGATGGSGILIARGCLSFQIQAFDPELWVWGRDRALLPQRPQDHTGLRSSACAKVGLRAQRCGWNDVLSTEEIGGIPLPDPHHLSRCEGGQPGTQPHADSEPATD